MLDILWMKDTSLEDSDSLPEPEVLALEIAADLQAAMELFAGIATDLKERELSRQLTPLENRGKIRRKSESLRPNRARPANQFV